MLLLYGRGARESGWGVPVQASTVVLQMKATVSTNQVVVKITKIKFTMEQFTINEILGKGLFLLLRSSWVRIKLFKTYSKARPVYHN